MTNFSADAFVGLRLIVRNPEFGERAYAPLLLKEGDTMQLYFEDDRESPNPLHIAHVDTRDGVPILEVYVWVEPRTSPAS